MEDLIYRILTDYFHLNSSIAGIVDVDVVPIAAETPLSQCKPPPYSIHVPVEKFLPSTQPDAEAPVREITPIV